LKRMLSWSSDQPRRQHLIGYRIPPGSFLLSSAFENNAATVRFEPILIFNTAVQPVVSVVRWDGDGQAAWNHTVYSKNRERLLNEEIGKGFFKRVLERAKLYMSHEHFTVDGTLIEAWASHKSFRPKDGTAKPPGAGGDVDFRGKKRKNQTHESTTDPDARLFTKSRGSEAKLSYMGHVLRENRNGLLVQTFLTEASGRTERDAAMRMAEAIPAGKPVTLGGDENYDTRKFVRRKSARVADASRFPSHDRPYSQRISPPRS
jgi:hypothetical protein